MSLAEDATRTSNFGKEEELRYHLSQMQYYFECAQNEADEVAISLSQFFKHKAQAEAIKESLEAVC